jgi:hypothetical protein
MAKEILHCVVLARRAGSTPALENGTGMLRRSPFISAVN